MYGTAAEINFWDVIYFRAQEAGGEFDTSTEELAEQAGLSRQMMGQLRREAVERGQLAEEVSLVSGRRFALQVPGLDQLARGFIWKPMGYVRNGWHRVVTPAIPKRVLNLYLQQPRQQVYNLDVTTIAAKCKRRFPCSEHHPVAPLNPADVSQALRLLVRLGLLIPEGESMRIDWAMFNQPAPDSVSSFDTPDPHQHPLFCQAAAADPGRAEWAQELLDIGHYDIELHFADIFRDLAYVQDDDYAVLKAKVYRYRNRPPGPNRWSDTWKAFQYELKRRIAEVRTPKAILNLSNSKSALCPLALDLDSITGCVLAVRMVSRVEWPWYLEESSLHNPQSQVMVDLELYSGDRRLFARAVGPGDAEVRYTFHPDEWPDLSFSLRAHCDRPLPGVHVEAWLEARLRR